MGITIDDILITHHHFDHIGGLELLKPLIKGSVIGPKNNAIDLLDKNVGEGDIIESIGLQFSVFEVPGHTLDHIAFYSETKKEVLFCGDTIFSGGCGRVFEGTFEQMNHSLEKLMSLPSKTEIYCAHEYTLSNLQFALMAEPDNVDLKEYEINSKNKRENNIPTIPTTLGQELQINPFLRVAEISLREAISDKLDSSNKASNAEVFGFLRSWKDSL